MELKQLTGSEISKLNNKRIFLYKYSEQYIKELYRTFPEMPHIEGVIDSNIRLEGERNVTGFSFYVYGEDYIRKLPEDSALIITDGYFKECFDSLVNLGLDSDAHEVVYFFVNKNGRYYLQYNESYKDAPLEDIIVFRSGPADSAYVKGMDYSDNARALFEYMLSVHLNEKYHLVWIVKHPEEFKSIEDENENVEFLPFDGATTDDKELRDKYYRNLCLAKYLFMTDAYGFCRYAREDQIRVQLWHGCGFKTRTVFSRCEHRYEYTIVVSKVYAGIHQDIYGLREDQVLITGYPKEDLLFHLRKEWKELPGIIDAKKYIFWLPTFRKPVSQLAGSLYEEAPDGEVGLPMIRSYDDVDRLNKLLADNDTELVVKLHPFQDPSSILKKPYSNIALLTNEQIYDKGMQINEILGAADALISDYSSVAVDFLQLDRPIAFTLDDAEEYSNHRGFVFSPVRDWMPGAEIDSFDQMLDFITEIINGIDSSADKRHRIAGKMLDFNDDQSCRRVVEALGIV